MTVLTRQLSDAWNAAWEKFRTFAGEFAGDRAREMDSSLIEALNCQFLAGADIIEFYFRRNRMLNGQGSPAAAADALEQLVRKQIAISDRMAELCELDPRLGYHSEAEVYKYFPEKLRWRSKALRYLLDEEFPKFRQGLAQGRSPSELLEEPPRLRCGRRYEAEGYSWEAAADGSFLKITADLDKIPGEKADDVLTVFVGDRLAAQRPWVINAWLEPTRADAVDGMRGCATGSVRELDGRWHVEFFIPLALLADADCCRVGLERHVVRLDGSVTYFHFPQGEYNHDARLQFGAYTPDMMAALKF